MKDLRMIEGGQDTKGLVALLFVEAVHVKKGQCHHARVEKSLGRYRGKALERSKL